MLSPGCVKQKQRQQGAEPSRRSLGFPATLKKYLHVWCKYFYQNGRVTLNQFLKLCMGAGILPPQAMNRLDMPTFLIGMMGLAPNRPPKLT